MFEIVNLKKTYVPKKGVPVEALKGIDLKFEDRGLVFILGRSGSGKSTLLHLMGGLDSITEGEVILNGVSTKNFKPADYDRYRSLYLGFVFQDYNLLSELTVEDNIALGLEVAGKKTENIEETLALVGLEGMGKRKPRELSGGQRQRVAIARAIAKDPGIILADEPTGALDEETGEAVLRLLKELSKEKLIIVVTHDRDFAREYGDRVIELSDGRVVSDTQKLA